ncbi:hypothetical protein KJ966_14085 [bacterium]|nr:hypothetical protein [bacterium]
MDRLFRLFVILASLILIVSACQTHKVELTGEDENSKRFKVAFEDLKNERVETIKVDYIVDCKVRLKTLEESQSGNCQIVLTHDLKFLLTIIHPMGGVLIKIYADDKILQVKDFSKMSYREYELSKKSKMNLPLIKDFSLLELQTVLWGRILVPVEKSLKYELDENKQIRRITKPEKDKSLEVGYNGWLTYKGSQFPRILIINNQKSGSSIKLAITQFQPGFAKNLKIDKEFKQKKKSEALQIN